MNIPRTPALRLALTALGLAMLTSAAEATKEDYCGEYTRAAIYSNQANLAGGCGFSGPRWQSIFDNHYNWCMSAPESASQSEAQARRSQLLGCAGNQDTNAEYCRIYTMRAIKSNGTNQNRGCGFSGARWHYDFNRHFRWCMAATRSAAVSETQARQNQLQSCTGGGGGGGGCPLLQAPAQRSPADGSVFSHFPRDTVFRWQPVPGAARYEIEIDCLHCCQSGKWCSQVGQVHKRAITTNTQYVHSFVGAQPGRWRVRAIPACGRRGQFSGWWNFRYTK